MNAAGTWIGVACMRCGTTARALDGALCDHCGGPLQTRYDLKRVKETLDLSSQGAKGSILNRWKELLPISEPKLVDRVFCGEKETPLVRSSAFGEKSGFPNLHFKLEFSGPSLSLKDRGTSLCALKALEFGRDTLCVASSGNNAASVAAYAAKARLRAIVFVQRNVSPSKIAKVLAHGATIVRVDGTMSVASRLCSELSERHHWFNCGGTNPYRSASKRTVAYEIVAELGTAPDVVAFPVGGGTGMVSAYSGFMEMLEMGLIPALPRMVGVQFEACDPVTTAYQREREQVEPMEPAESISDALMNGTPYWGARALDAARTTGGAFVSVADDECRDTLEQLATQEGLFLEPAGAISVAGIRKLRAENRLDGVDSVVCMLTGHGANATGLEAAVEVIAPDLSAIESYLAL